MKSNETDARIRIDKKLIDAGWKLPEWSNNEEINVSTEINNKSGRADYVLLSSKDNNLCTIEAKKTLLSPLVGKEQARDYAVSLNCRFKGLFTPYEQKELGSFFSPLKIRASTKIGLEYNLPGKN